MAEYKVFVSTIPFDREGDTIPAFEPIGMAGRSADDTIEAIKAAGGVVFVKVGDVEKWSVWESDCPDGDGLCGQRFAQLGHKSLYAREIEEPVVAEICPYCDYGHDSDGNDCQNCGGLGVL